MVRNYERLFQFLEDRAAMPFGWARSRNNCVTFAARAVRAQTGRNPLGDLRWNNLEEGRALLDKLGGLEAAVSERLQPIAPAMAQRGDIAGVEDKRFGLRLMVVEGATLVGPGARGARRLPRSAMIAAWSAMPGDGENV